MELKDIVLQDWKIKTLFNLKQETLKMKNYDGFKMQSKRINTGNSKQVDIYYPFPNLEIKLSTTGAIPGDAGNGGNFTIEAKDPEIVGEIIIFNNHNKCKAIYEFLDIDKIQINFYGGMEVDILQDIAKEINKLITIKNKEIKDKYK